MEKVKCEICRKKLDHIFIKTRIWHNGTKDCNMKLCSLCSLSDKDGAWQMIDEP